MKKGRICVDGAFCYDVEMLGCKSSRGPMTEIRKACDLPRFMCTELGLADAALFYG